jgi:hypothetical protein
LPLFRKFLAAETSFIRRIEESGRTCGVPSDYLRQVREGHAKALEIGKDVCVTAAQKEKWPPGDYWRPGERLPGR